MPMLRRRSISVVLVLIMAVGFWQPKMIRNDSVASRLAELQPSIEARLKGAEKIAQVVEDKTPAAEQIAQVVEDRTPCQALASSN